MGERERGVRGKERERERERECKRDRPADEACLRHIEQRQARVKHRRKLLLLLLLVSTAR